jgi:hypothetical protein
MDFIGRTSELSTLEKEYKRNGGFVVIYGRRRVGKTTLIKEFLKNKIGFYFLATRETETLSMKRFAGVISRVTNNTLLNNVTFNDWVDLFKLIADYKPTEKKVLVIDEFPYLVKTNPAFPSVIQNIWDEYLKDSNVMLILCGSLLGMMKKHTLDYDSPLYGRRTAQIRLMPLTFTEVYVNRNMSFENAVMQYSVTGGVPKYMEFFNDNTDLTEQIKETVLSRNGFLYEEPNFLLDEEVQVPTNYFSIIKAIADGNHKIGNISGILNLDSTTLAPYMTTLAELGFIVREVPVTEKNPAKSRKGLYFISDNFIRFWFRYVYPYKGELELDNTQIVIDEMEKDFVKKFVAFSYEYICQNIFAELCKSKRINFVPSKIGSYWLNDITGDTQIDVMAVDNTNKAVFCGECKYHKQKVDADVYFDLKKKVETSQELKKVFSGYKFIYGVFSKSGFTDRLLDINKNNTELYLINEDTVI